MKSRLACVAAGIVAVLWSAPASAQDESWSWNVNYGWEGALIGGFVGGSLLISNLDVDTSRRWKRELLPWDMTVRERYSDTAAARSDGILALTVAGPMFAMLGSGWDESTSRRGLIYAETLSAGMFFNVAIKHLVQRPRPFVYSVNPEVMKKGRSKDSHLSFFSGHSSTAFAAAVAGSYLFGAQEQDENTRAALWGTELTLASAAANLRVRAGRHNWSDVVLGAMVGAGLGATVPRLHLDQPNRYAPTRLEVAAMGAGVAAGTVIAWVMPMSDDILVGLHAKDVDVVPVALPGGAAMTVAGRF